jgi:hypothetical protein
LIELLVVIVILTTLVAAAIPLLSPAGDERRTREASRGVNSFIGAAQMKAIELQRPYGVALKKLSVDTGRSDPDEPENDNGVCVELYYVEQPPAYTGFDRSSAVRVALYTPEDPDWYGGNRALVLLQFVSRGNATAINQDGLPIGWDADLFPGGIIRPGDVIETAGTRYQLLYDEDDVDLEARFTDNSETYFASNTGKPDAGNDPTMASKIVARPLNDSGQLIDVQHDENGWKLELRGSVLVAVDPINTGVTDVPDSPYYTNPHPYKILRQPTPASAPPYQLPEGTAIDLRASGIALEFKFKSNFTSETDIDGFFHKSVKLEEDAPYRIDNSDPIIIMFSPEGSVERLRISNEPVDTVDGETELPTFDEPIATNFFLLVGARENIPAPSQDDDQTLDTMVMGSALTDEERATHTEKVNWLRPTSRWIVIGGRTGRVVTAENAFVDLRDWSNNSTDYQDYQDSDPLVRRAMQIDASREFAREMTQLGGR